MQEIYKKYCEEFFDEAGVLRKIKIKVPENFNFGYDILDEIAKKYPSNLAVLWCDAYGNEKRITFEQMSKLSNQAANLFISNGIKPKDFVMLILKRNYEYWYIINALHKIGAIAVPGTHLLTSEDLEYRVKLANIHSAVFSAQSGIPEKILSVCKKCDQLENLFSVRGDVDGCLNISKNLQNYSDKLDRIQTDARDTMLAYFTSGTTGHPKLVEHCYSYPLGHLITAKHWQNVRPNGLHLTISDTGWGKAAWGKLYGQWMMGTVVVVYDFEKFVANDILNIIEKYQINTFCAPPTIYRFFMKEGLGTHDISCLEYATTAGEPLNYEIIKQFKEKTGLQIMEAYGQTETTAILINQVGQNSKPGSLGTPSPLYDVVLADKDCCDVGVGQAGEICVKIKSDGSQVGLFKRYHKNQELDKFARRGGMYHTGDVAIRDSDGYFWYVGRIDDVIKSSGYRIGPFEIESVLMEHPAVLECGIIGVPDDIRGQVVKANVVLTSAYSPSDKLAKELQDFVKSKTAPYKYPRIIEFMDRLPKTISGKIRRNVLRKSHIS